MLSRPFSPCVTLTLWAAISWLASSCGGQTEEEVPRAPGTELSQPDQADPTLTLERIFSDPPIAGASPRGISFSPDGRWVAFLKPNEDDGEILDLWAIDLHDETGLEARPLVRTRDLLGDQEASLSEEERMANERQRVRHRGITSYRFCGRTSSKLLFPLSGQVFLVDVGDGAKASVTSVFDEESPRLDPRCSPSGQLLGFVEDGNFKVYDLARKSLVFSTTEAGATRKFGVAEFIAQEEMGRYRGFWFSEDDRYVAYTDVDESPVGVKSRARIQAGGTETFEQRYPAAGEANAKVGLVVRARTEDAQTALALPADEDGDPGYLARVAFAPEGGGILVQWQNRAQTRLEFLHGQPGEFGLRQVLVDEDPAWVELTDDLAFVSAQEFLFSSERGGTRQVYLADVETGVKRQVTAFSDPVVELHGVYDEDDEATLLVTVATDRSRQRQLFRVDLADGAARRVTSAAGTHRVVPSADGAFFVDTYSRFMKPPEVTLRAALDDREAYAFQSPEPTPLEEARLPEVTFMDIPVDDVVLNAVLMAPRDRAPGARYPVLTYVYGGPHAQLATDRFLRLTPVLVHLTQLGFGVFVVDNRGSGNRDRDFTRAIHRRFADIEIKDQLAGQAHLATVPWVDPDRIAVFGWSYGGYLSALLMLEEATPYACGIGVAPVTDWTLYDTHYTERYLGKPQEGRYEDASVLARAGRLQRPYLLVHGMADDNVLFENSLKLIDAWQETNRQFDLMVYPGGAHGLRGRASQTHVFSTIRGFLLDHLCPGGVCGRVPGQ